MRALAEARAASICCTLCFLAVTAFSAFFTWAWLGTGSGEA